MTSFKNCTVCKETFTVHGMPAHMYLKHGIKHPRNDKKVVPPEQAVRIYITAQVREKVRMQFTRERDTYDKVLMYLIEKNGR